MLRRRRELVVGMRLVVRLSRILAHVKVPPTVRRVALLVREDRERRTVRTPAIGRVTMRRRGCDHFLTGMVQRTQATSARRHRSSVPGIDGRAGSLTRVVVLLRLVEAARADFLVGAGLFVAQEGGHVADVAGPSTGANKVLAATTRTSAAASGAAGRGRGTTTLRRRGWTTVRTAAAVVHLVVVRRRSVHIVERWLTVVAERLRIVTLLTRSIDAVGRQYRCSHGAVLLGGRRIGRWLRVALIFRRLRHVVGIECFLVVVIVLLLGSWNNHMLWVRRWGIPSGGGFVVVGPLFLLIGSQVGFRLELAGWRFWFPIRVLPFDGSGVSRTVARPICVFWGTPLILILVVFGRFLFVFRFQCRGCNRNRNSVCVS